MKNKELKNLDHIHVSSKTKNELLEKAAVIIEKREKKERINYMKYKGLLAAGLAFAVVLGLISMNGNKMPDYDGYINAVAEYVEEPQEMLNRDKIKLDQQLLEREITIEEYLEIKNDLNRKQSSINQKKTDLRDKYKISEENFQNKTYSKDPQKNQQIINNLQKEFELDRREDELERLEDKAIQDYKNGTIMSDQLIGIMAELDAKDEILDMEEDRLDGESADPEDREEYELAQKFVEGKITAQEYLKQKEAIDRKYDEIDDLEDDDDDDDDDDEEEDD